MPWCMVRPKVNVVVGTLAVLPVPRRTTSSSKCARVRDINAVSRVNIDVVVVVVTFIKVVVFIDVVVVIG